MNINMMILYQWDVMWLRTLKPDGVLMNPAPAPLTGSEIAQVFGDLTRHPAYKHQTIVAHSAPDREVVTLKDGAITREPEPQP